MSELRKPAGRAVTAEDVLALKIVGDPQISPDGAHVACTVTTADAQSNAYQTHLWIIPVGAGAPRQLTTVKGKDTGPRWSPDGRRIAFISDRSGEKQVWVIDVDGGEAHALTSGSLAPGELCWSPDGLQLACVGKPQPKPGPDESDVRVISRLRYKQDGEGYWDGRWKQLFVVAADGGAPRQVTRGDHDHLGPAWSPDGRSLAYTGNPAPDADLSGVSDVWVVPSDGGTPSVRLTDGRGPAQLPAWSPDGTRIAYLGHDNEYWGATHLRVWAVPASGGTPTSLTPTHERSIGHHLAGDVRVETRGEHELVGCSLDRAARRVACVESDPVSPGEVAVAELGGAGGAAVRRLTRWNSALVDGLALSRPERFECRGADGWPIECWVMKPGGIAAGARVPAVLEIHGGPHSTYGNGFMHQFQLLCAAGYGVVYSNPRGSHGYTQAFTAATHHDWGGRDYDDLMRALDHAVEANRWIDADRLGVAGGSYGGYMVNWMIGHTRRFRAAVSLRSTCDRYSQWGTSDMGVDNGRWEFPGDPWTADAFYRERSPITYVAQMRTPLLLAHGENDLRCPISQSEQLFVALVKQGTPAVLVRFPGESHNMSSGGKPKHRVEQLRHILGWFEKHLGST